MAVINKNIEEVPYFQKLFDAEDRHFWFQARNHVIGDCVRNVVGGFDDGYRVLEVGCGDGNVLRVLESVCDRGVVIGSELHEEGFQYARQRVKCQLVAADVYNLPFREPFHLVGMFDVLEHLPDDLGALQSLRGSIVPGGAIVITVPAHMWLYSYVDTLAGHFTRYNPAGLRNVLEAAGFRVEFISQFMIPLVPAMWLMRRVVEIKKRLGLVKESDLQANAHEEYQVSGLANAIMGSLLRFERPLLARKKSLPSGTSLLALAYNDSPLNVPIEATIRKSA